MATLPLAGAANRAQGEARFFFLMACLMSAIIVAGFSFNIVTARSSFGAPLLVHIHAVVMMGWVGLYLAQNFLVFSGNIAVHRRLGWLSVVWLPLVLVMGLLITRWSLQERGGPPFFDQNQFLISNPLHLLGFAVLATWAVMIRANTGWHRRLMYCAFAMLLGPGVGRLLPAPLLIPYAWYVSALLPTICFMVAGILSDNRRYRRPHPAWFWGIGAVLGIQIAADLVAYSPLGYQLTEWTLAGTPGAERQMEAFVPPM